MHYRDLRNAIHRVAIGQGQHSDDANRARDSYHGRRGPGSTAFRLGGVRKHRVIHAAPTAILLGNVVSTLEPKNLRRKAANEFCRDYAAKVFGFATFGRVYGAIICLSGLVNLSQPLIDAANHKVFHNNPIPINIILSSLGLIFGTCLVVFVWVKGREIPAVSPGTLEASERDRLIIREVEEPEDE